MNMNDDSFFDDMQDDIQDGDVRDTRAYQDEKNRKTKLILTVVFSFIFGLLLLGIVLFFLSSDKDEDMIAINSFQPSAVQPQIVKNSEINAQNNDTIARSVENNQLLSPVVQNEVVENKPVIKKVVKRLPVKKKDVVLNKVKTPRKLITISKPVLRGAWKVQLMSVQDRENNPSELKMRMTDAWNKLVLANPVLKGHIHDIEQTDIKGFKWYRLRVVGLKNSTEASNLCADLKSNNVACVIVK